MEAIDPHTADHIYFPVAAGAGSAEAVTGVFQPVVYTEVPEVFAPGIETRQTVTSAEPQTSPVVLQGGKDDILRQSVGLGVNHEPAAVAFELIKPAAGGNPERTSAILMNVPENITAQASGIIGIMHESGKPLLLAVKAVEPAVPGGDPERSGTVFMNKRYSIAAQTKRIVGFMPEVDKLFMRPIKAVEPPAKGGDPEITAAVFVDRDHPVVAQAR